RCGLSRRIRSLLHRLFSHGARIPIVIARLRIPRWHTRDQPSSSYMIAKVYRVRITSLPPLEVDSAYLRPSQWRHIDLNRALFAQYGGGRVDGSNDTESNKAKCERDKGD